jgi:hypothetical protein
LIRESHITARTIFRDINYSWNPFMFMKHAKVKEFEMKRKEKK